MESTRHMPGRYINHVARREEEAKQARDMSMGLKKTLSEIREEPGSSNAGDYPNVKKGDFCGPAGGAAEGTYPVNTRKRGKSALKLAHNAPNPDGIKNCVYEKYPGLRPGKNKITRRRNKK